MSRFARASGILLHPTSLPGASGIGDFGQEAYRFVDFLAAAGQTIWQVLPLGPNEGGNPYHPLSIAAGNPLLISLESLARDGFLETSDLAGLPPASQSAVDFKAVAAFKSPVLRKSYAMFRETANPGQRQDYHDFCSRSAGWLNDYALFMALREAHHLASWSTWEEDIRNRKPAAMESWKQRLENAIDCHRYQQYQFFRQWRALRQYSAGCGIRIIGDIPIFVSHNSAEVWAHPEMFYLDQSCAPTVVAGVPPDYFSETGQRWGNPLYRWDRMAQDGYKWWIDRFRFTINLVDVVRIDHFRGFEAYWEIPASEPNARRGRWLPGPGAALFEAIKKELGDVPVIAEDLGVITPEVIALRDRFDFPGLKVLQFAFGGGGSDNPYLPHNYIRNCVVYTGTHDNNTTVGWFRGGSGDTTQTPEEMERERQAALKYLGGTSGEINWDLIRLALASIADIAIIPLQDVMGLGGEARMNRPAVTEGNWRWRYTAEQITAAMTQRLGDMTATYGRARKN